jgi:hypothetical protein
MNYRDVHMKDWIWKNEMRDGMEDGYERWNGKNGIRCITQCWNDNYGSWNSECELSCAAPPGALKP